MYTLVTKYHSKSTFFLLCTCRETRWLPFHVKWQFFSCRSIVASRHVRCSIELYVRLERRTFLFGNMNSRRLCRLHCFATMFFLREFFYTLTFWLRGLPSMWAVEVCNASVEIHSLESYFYDATFIESLFVSVSA